MLVLGGNRTASTAGDLLYVFKGTRTRFKKSFISAREIGD